MRLQYFIARRYLFAKKSVKAINYIAMITAIAMGVGTAALVIVLSVFNGFEGLVKDLYKVFYSDASILPVDGKYFDLDESKLQALKKQGIIVDYNYTIEENALVVYEGKQYIATIKGVDSNYIQSNKALEEYMLEGELSLGNQYISTAVVGAGVAASLGINIRDPLKVLEIYMPKRNKSSLAQAENAFNKSYIRPIGTFAVQQEFDSKWVIVPYAFAEQLLEVDKKVSNVDVKLPKKNYKELQAALGNEVKVLSRYEQNATLYKIMQTEKWVVFALLIFIITIAAFNIIGTLSMLVLEKKKDIFILNTLGMQKKNIMRLFLIEGSLLAIIGGGTGIIVALLLCFLQQLFGIIPMPGNTFVIESYPIRVYAIDVICITLALVVIAVAMAYFPARRAANEINILYTK